MKIKHVLFCVMLMLCLFPAAGCNKGNTEETFAEVPTETPEPVLLELPEKISSLPNIAPTPEPTEDLTGKAKNIFTGYYIDEQVAKKRPVAVVFNNLKRALPQSGISSADLYYEVLAEGDIVRVIGIFHGGRSERIGTVRSSRHYFLNFALDCDAIYTHFGSSEMGYAALKNLKIDNLDGIFNDGTYFWRDQGRIATAGYEHSAFTSMENIETAAEKLGYRTEISENYKPMWDFYQDFSFPDGGQLTNKITVPFSPGQQSIFIYDYKNNIFHRYQGENAHIDEETGEQLTVSNIIVQFVNMYVIAGDKEGRREVNLVSSGSGYMITGGQYVPITWKKESHEKPTEWFDANGNKLKLNKGKTWICVFSDKYDVKFE